VFKSASKNINLTNAEITKTSKLMTSLNNLINLDKNKTKDFESGGLGDSLFNPSPDDKQRKSLYKFFRRPSTSGTKDIKTQILQKVNQISKINAEKEKLKEEVRGGVLFLDQRIAQ
jgi:hypothetical protein